MYFVRLIFCTSQAVRKYFNNEILAIYSNNNLLYDVIIIIARIIQFEKFLHPDATSVASVFAPISYPPQPVLLFKAQGDGSHTLVASGSLLSANPSRVICKRIVLSGHPFKINKKSAVIRYMFFNRGESEYSLLVVIMTYC